VTGFEGMDVGHRLNVQLIRTDVERGFIDFGRLNNVYHENLSSDVRKAGVT